MFKNIFKAFIISAFALSGFAHANDVNIRNLHVYFDVNLSSNQEVVEVVTNKSNPDFKVQKNIGKYYFSVINDFKQKDDNLYDLRQIIKLDKKDAEGVFSFYDNVFIYNPSKPNTKFKLDVTDKENFIETTDAYYFSYATFDNIKSKDVNVSYVYQTYHYFGKKGKGVEENINTYNFKLNTFSIDGLLVTESNTLNLIDGREIFRDTHHFNNEIPELKNILIIDFEKEINNVVYAHKRNDTLVINKAYKESEIFVRHVYRDRKNETLNGNVKTFKMNKDEETAEIFKMSNSLFLKKGDNL